MKRFLTPILLLALGNGTAMADPTMDMSGQHAPDHHAAAPAAPTAATAAQTDGEIRKVDVAAQKLTVKHGRIENLGMSAMTMAYRVKDPAFLAQVKPGDQVKMRVERIDGVLTIVALQRVP